MILVLQFPESEALLRGIQREGAAAVESVDVTDMRAVRAVVEARRPEAVVLSAWRDAAGAEADPDRAFRVSAEAAINLAAAALEFECRPVYLSVADVFGQVGGPFDVSDVPEPSAIFAEAALRGERFLGTASRGRGLVVRSGPWVESVEAALRAGELAPTRSKVTPIRLEDLGAALRRWMGEPGLVHAASKGPAVDVAALYRTVAEWHGLTARISPSESDLALTPRLSPSSEPLPPWDRTETSTPAAPPQTPAPEEKRTEGVVLEDFGLRSELRRLAPGEAWPLSAPGHLWVLEGKVLVEGQEDVILGVGLGRGLAAGTVRPVLPSQVLFVRTDAKT